MRVPADEPPSRLVSRARAASTRRRRLGAVVIVAAAAVAAAAALLMIVLRPPDPEPEARLGSTGGDVTTVKGLPSAVVHVKRGERVFVWDGSEPIEPGDALRL